jgi:hypothetical protein
MTPADFIRVLETDLHLRGGPFDRAVLAAVVSEASWRSSLSDDDPILVAQPAGVRYKKDCQVTLPPFAGISSVASKKGRAS